MDKFRAIMFFVALVSFMVCVGYSDYLFMRDNSFETNLLVISFSIFVGSALVFWLTKDEPNHDQEI